MHQAGASTARGSVMQGPGMGEGGGGAPRARVCVTGRRDVARGRGVCVLRVDGTWHADGAR
eukprot:4357993-Prymnesium_polylepis.1